MPFWKQSDDPWDRKPPKQFTEPREPRENPLDTLKTWNDQRKTAAKEKEEARRLPPEKCPWCGKDMEQGYLHGGRGTLYWTPGVKPGLREALIGPSNDAFQLDCEGVYNVYVTAWHCPECKKLMIDAAGMRPAYNIIPSAETEETAAAEPEESEDTQGRT